MNTMSSTGETFVQRHTKRRSTGFLGWLRRITFGFMILLIALAATGATYQAVATARDTAAFPAPGQLVDVGGYKLHIHCVGDGRPTVVLEASLANISSDWSWVQPEVAKTTRVCSYDRAGNGWSDPGPLPRDAHQIAHELHTLLDKANVPGPYVLVGHSFGGLYIRMFAAQYPKNVVGMVFVDASHPDMWSRMPASLVAREQLSAGQRILYSTLTRFGISRLTGGFPANCGLPARQCGGVEAWGYTTKYVDSFLSEMFAPERDAQVRATGTLGTMPVVVVTATVHEDPRLAETPEVKEFEQTWKAMQRELAALSSNSLHHIVEGATHSSLQFDQQTALVTSDAIRQVVEAARTGQPLPRN
jgi:pimeloyl-ACP methyl ester carboxylesterase